MGVWQRVFGRASQPALQCGACGKSLHTEMPVMAGSGSDPFADAVRLVADVLATPGYVCAKCATVVCKGCLPLGEGSRACPKCGSTETRQWTET